MSQPTMSKEQLLALLAANRAKQAAAPKPPTPVQAALKVASAAVAVAVAVAERKPAPQIACTPELAERDPKLAESCQNLANALWEQEPEIGGFLDAIHEQLRAEPELMHILTEEQIRAVYTGFIAQSGKQLASSKSKSKSTPTSAQKAILAASTEDDGL